MTSGFRTIAATLVFCAVISGGGSCPTAAFGATFESMVATATRVTELPVLLKPMLDDCGNVRGDVEKQRCLGIRAYMRKRLPARTFVSVGSDPHVVSVSEYDARVKGFLVRVAGCLACKTPVLSGGAKRFVTFKAPPKGATGLVSSVEVAQSAVTFNDIADSERWTKTVRPHLRAEFVYKPSEEEWTLGASRGYAFTLLGTRVFDGCTGEVVFSQPESTEAAAKILTEGCSREASVAGVEAAADAEDLPAQLDPSTINTVMATSRVDVDACYDLLKMNGTAFLNFDVPGSGRPHAVTLEGTLGGTSTGLCLLEAARKVQFPKFKVAHQKFRYPIVFKAKVAAPR